MVDYIKFIISDRQDVIDYLLNSKELDFKGNLSESTGEYDDSIVEAEIHTCKIIICRGEKFKYNHVLFTGSIHKMYNAIHGIQAPNKIGVIKNTRNTKGSSKGFNGNEFNLHQINTIIEYLENLMGCSRYDMRLQNIEFGVNCNVNFNPVILIIGLLYHRGEVFEISRKGHFAKVIHQQFILKAYNKGNQYGMNGNILRLEIHYCKMKEVNALGVFSLGDLTKTSLYKAKAILFKKVNEITYYDNTIDEQSKKLKELQKKKLISYSNLKYWLELESNHRDRPKKDLKNIIEISSQNLKEQILLEINNQFEKLNV